MFEALSRDLTMIADPVTADLVHVHTWYAHLAGVLVQLAYGIPLVLTVHSLEPLRPWKREQLGGGYDVSSWVERNAIEAARAVIAVSRGTREDILRLFDVPSERVHVIHNGIDADFYRLDGATNFLEERGIDPSVPYVLFVGRVTRQKGIVHLVRAIHHSIRDRRRAVRRPPDTPEIAREMAAAVRAAQAERPNVVWIGEMVPRRRPPAVLARRRVLLPIGLRAVRDHQPRGGSMRDAGRGVGRGRHPGGGRRRRDRPAGAGRASAETRAADGSGALRAQPGRGGQRAHGRALARERMGRAGDAARSSSSAGGRSRARRSSCTEARRE